MKTASAFLRKNSLAVSLALAVVVALILAEHIASIPILPTVDGKGYALRAFALYGFLHTGQWAHFWQLFHRPAQSILPLHDLPFLILPQAWAGFTGYVVAQYVTTFVLLAYAIYRVAKALERPEWAPAIFLLCAFNNVAWIDFYAFFLDMQFCGLGLLVIAFQIEAWKEPRPRNSLLAGAALAWPFFLKPANALIFLVTYVLSELFYIALSWRIDPATGRLHFRRPLWTRWGCQALGFLPLLLIAAKLGAVQTILQLINVNEIRERGSPIACIGLFRLFYFPLCFAALYDVLLLGGLFLVPLLLSKWIPRLRRPIVPHSWPIEFFLPIVFSYLIWGEFFSFWMMSKPLRSLLLMVPLFWLLACWLWEKRRLRWEIIFAVALIYGALVYDQKEFDGLGTRDELLVDDSYQLTSASWSELPSAWHHKWSLNTVICDQVIHDVPPRAIVCVNAMETRHALAWRLDNGPLLRGEATPYETRNIFDYRGRYCNTALVGANVVVLITFYPVQTSRSIWLHSLAALDYGQQTWCGTNPIAHMVPLLSVRGEPAGYEFIFDRPLTQADVDALNQSPVFADSAGQNFAYVNETLYGRHFSREGAENVISTWLKKRFPWVYSR